MDDKKKRLLDNFLSLGALKIFSYIIPLLTLPYQTRVLGVEKFGLVYFAYAFMAYFDILTDFGFNLSATREIAVNRHNNNSISNIFNSVMSIKLVLITICFVILLLTIVFVPKIRDNYIIFLLSFLMCVGNAIYPVWFFQGMERMRYTTCLNILSRMIFLVLIFVFVKQQSDYVIVPLLNSAGALTAGILGYILAVRTFKLKVYIPNLTTIKKQFKYSSEFFISRVSLSLCTNTNTVCLGFITSGIAVGYYVAAEKIYNAIRSLTGPLTGALYPYITKNRDIKLFNKLFKVLVIGVFFVSLFAFIFAKDIISIFYGDQMLEAYKVFRVFCLLFLITMPYTLIGYPLLGAMGHIKECNYSVVAESAIHITGLVVLICLKKLDIYTMSYWVTFTSFLGLLIRGYFVIKYNLLRDREKLKCI